MNVRDITAYPAVANEPVTAMQGQEGECSEIQLRCPARHYSASAIALAAEDADASVVTLAAYPSPGGDGQLEVYLRINRLDPSRAVRSLERHGFTVSRAEGAQYADEELGRERLSELQHYLNI